MQNVTLVGEAIVSVKMGFKMYLCNGTEYVCYTSISKCFFYFVCKKSRNRDI